MERLTLLRTGAGSPVAPFVIGELRAAGVRVIAADMVPLSVGFASADSSTVIPPARAEGFVAALLDICGRERVDVLFPDVDEEFLPISRARAAFEAIGVRVLLSSVETLERCTDKLRFAATLEQLGLPYVRSFRDDELSADLPFPLIVKPRQGRGSVNVHRVEDLRELHNVLQQVPDPVVQEFAPGREFTIDTLSTLDARFLYASVRERLQADSGVSIKGRTIQWPTLEEMARRIVDGLGVVGPCCLQCILDGEGRPRFTDCNPRLGGGTVLSIAAGAPIIRDLVRLLRGEPAVGKRQFRAGVVMLRSWQETYLDPIQRVRAVALDLDDTLIDRQEWVRGALASVASTMCDVVRIPEDVLQQSLSATWRRLGTDHDHLFDAWLESLGLRPTDHLSRCVEAFHAYRPKELTLRSGMADALRLLRENGIPTAVVTDGRISTQEAKITMLGLQHLVDHVVYCAASGAAKPDPAGLNEAARRLGIPASDILFVGDHPRYDVVMARRAGALAARVLVGEFADRPDDPEGTADLTAADVPDVVRRVIDARVATVPPAHY